MSSRVAIGLLCLILAACGGGGERAPVTGKGGGIYKVGNPYKINGIWYHPEEDPHYDETGIASWYGPNFHGKRTANGEVFDMNELTAAHPTLPMPSFVKVTNLDNGRSVVLRVNDRGPFARGRVLDASRRAAQLLDFQKNGVARVRVQAYPGGEKKQDDIVPVRTTELSDGDTRWFVDEALDEATSPLSLFVQAGAFSEKSRAEALRGDLARIGDAGISSVEVEGRQLYRVRIGPVPSAERADDILNQVVALGYPSARVVVECDRSC